MRRSFFVPATLALVFSATGAQAQDRPDFSGAWTLMTQPAQVAGSLGSGWGSSFTIMQGARTLTVERAFFSRADLQPPVRLRYALDGSETRNTILMGRGEQAQISTTTWDGEKLKITTVHVVPDAGDGQPIASEVTRTLSLLPPSGGRLAWPPSLVIETIRGGVLGGPPSTTRTVYIRS